MSEYITEFFGSSSGGSYTERRERIVRCRDCKHYDDYLGSCVRGNVHQVFAAEPDGFCAWGERKNESLVEFIEKEGRKRDTND